VTDERDSVELADALRVWGYVGLNSFGGPAGQIAVMHRELVERRRWIDERRFLDALNYCMLLPGPEAQQLATYIGWLFNGVRGGLAAGLLFVLPGVVVLLVLSILYALFQETTAASALFYGVKPAVVAVVADAVLRLGRRAITGPVAVAIAVVSFVAIFFFDAPFPLIVAAAAALGIATQYRRTEAATAGAAAHDVSAPLRPSTSRTLLTIAVWLGIWLSPVLVSVMVLGPASVFTQLALFFSFAAMITFGGAYAVLAFIAQQAVDVYGWLTAHQMVDGLGLAESTPGPLIMVVQFVGFMAAFGRPEGLDPLLAGLTGALLVSWVTFAPSFLWIFAGAPYIEYLRRRPLLSSALWGISPAVVGVIVNLAAWFALQTFFSVTGELRAGPLRLHTVELASIDLFAVGLAVAAFIALARLKVPLLIVLAGSGLMGAAVYVLAPR
jgi:chromate transporter